ncbi:hypothetical protein [uncultured Cohaesibacter sp.]|uniref:hypothetical protein n=1 Tax=uncultured Cohaesibacter sp. TaxID=1002546 RepID=UPI002930AB97|nr:hypothetical protein [uncultured Cohaesibacter sp.]
MPLYDTGSENAPVGSKGGFREAPRDHLKRTERQLWAVVSRYLIHACEHPTISNVVFGLEADY